MRITDTPQGKVAIPVHEEPIKKEARSEKSSGVVRVKSYTTQDRRGHEKTSFKFVPDKTHHIQDAVVFTDTTDLSVDEALVFKHKSQGVVTEFVYSATDSMPMYVSETFYQGNVSLGTRRGLIEVSGEHTEGQGQLGIHAGYTEFDDGKKQANIRLGANATAVEVCLGAKVGLLPITLRVKGCASLGDIGIEAGANMTIEGNKGEISISAGAAAALGVDAEIGIGLDFDQLHDQWEWIKGVPSGIYHYFAD